MKRYLYNYIEEIDNLLSNHNVTKDIIEEHFVKIKFFQHERLVHLLVTLFYALLFLIFMILGVVHFLFFFISFVISIFLICYVVHYFRLENGVHYLYKQYDKMIEK